MTQQVWRDRIVYENGTLCIKGTRIPIAAIVGLVGEAGIDTVLRQHPQLKKEDVQAALYHAASTVLPEYGLRFLLAVVPPLPGVSCSGGEDGQIEAGKPGFVVVADNRSGWVRVFYDHSSACDFSR